MPDSQSSEHGFESTLCYCIGHFRSLHWCLLCPGWMTLYVVRCTYEELLNIVHNAKDKKSKGYDGIDMCMLKKIIPHILTPLRHICNTSLGQGIFPDEMKIARIIPLFKSGDKQNVSNYRPISLLPQFPKILEKIFNNRLMNFLNSNNLLYLRQ